MNRLVSIVSIVIAATLIVGCGKKKEEPAARPPQAAGSAMAGSSATAGSATAGSATAGSAMSAMVGSANAGSAATAAVDVPTEMDFEDEAKAKITNENVEAQVKSIESDLGK